METVEPGTMVMGYELHNSLGLKEGDEVDFQGKKLKIAKAHKPRGSTDDITIWMNLGEVQQLLGKDGQINAIQALECNCASIDRLGEIRAELMDILPDTQIIETESTALARAEARNQAKATAEKAIADVEREQQNLQDAREGFASVTLPVVALAAMAWIGLLTLTNVRDRITEIGILRAVGVKGGSIFSTFILRAALAGVVGALLGMAIFAVAFPAAAGRVFHGQGLTAVVAPEVWIAALIATPILAAASAWLPAMLAAQKDPAEVLRQD
ncbi:MAG: FtsX-like permease family protein [Verrucomicrobiota bacterium]